MPLFRPAPDRTLNLPLDRLRASVLAGGDIAGAAPVPGVQFHADPQARIAGRWTSPRARLLEVDTTVDTPGDWFALHIDLPLADLSGVAFLGFVARTAAARAMVTRACLRSGLPEGGFTDTFFDRHILSQPGEGDHVDLLAPDRRPDLPQSAPWREFILFLPPVQDIRWALHDLRLFVP
jgi:hypothetical protein